MTRLLHPTRLLPLAAAAALGACAGQAAPEPAPDPHRQVRVLTANDPELPAIALAAAKSIESPREPRFSGVFIDGREVKALSDSIARNAKLVRVEALNGKVPFAIARCDQIPCPVAGRPQAPETHALTAFRVTTDSAYVGSTISISGDIERRTCMTLVRRSGAWVVVDTRSISSARRCGQ
ncbi:MAG TPA: hypothetical protein VFO55_07665 [Gemmatimonadaceae bacterium]|nr:hypothetical protein [Gemmatimonadaceae bacterium]